MLDETALHAEHIPLSKAVTLLKAFSSLPTSRPRSIDLMVSSRDWPAGVCRSRGVGHHLCTSPHRHLEPGDKCWISPKKRQPSFKLAGEPRVSRQARWNLKEHPESGMTINRGVTHCTYRGMVNSASYSAVAAHFAAHDSWHTLSQPLPQPWSLQGDADGLRGARAELRDQCEAGEIRKSSERKGDER